MSTPTRLTRPHAAPAARSDDASALGYLLVDPLGVILGADAHASAILGATDGAAIGRPLRYYVDSGDSDRLRDYLVRCTQEVSTCRLRLRRAGPGLDRDVFLSCRPSAAGSDCYDVVLVALPSGDPPAVNGDSESSEPVMRPPDATASHIARQLIAAQESERRRIARELHDQLGQHLIALTVGMKQLERLVEGIPRAERVLEGLRASCDVLGQDIHRVALELRPSALDHLGLGPAVVSYAEYAARSAGLELDAQCSLPHGFALDPFTEITVYRIVQEAFTNIVKHARARHACVIIGAQDDALRVVIEDDGAGFVHGTSSTRLGMRGMHERAALIGGTLQIESRRGAGTTVFLRVASSGNLPPAELPMTDLR